MGTSGKADGCGPSEVLDGDWTGRLQGQVKEGAMGVGSESKARSVSFLPPSCQRLAPWRARTKAKRRQLAP